jgi:hypothetical protein
MVLWIRGWIVTNMRLYHAIFSGRPLASHAQVARIHCMNDTPDTLLGLYWDALKTYSTDWRSDTWVENVLGLFALVGVGSIVLAVLFAMISAPFRCA